MALFEETFCQIIILANNETRSKLRVRMKKKWGACSLGLDPLWEHALGPAEDSDKITIVVYLESHRVIVDVG
jgi:hypothetical protein